MMCLLYLYFSSEGEDEEEEEEEELELDESEESDMAGRNRRGGSGRRRRNAEPVRRSTRARITRFDKEFSKLILIITVVIQGVMRVILALKLIDNDAVHVYLWSH
jgi:hypothetical protein